MNFVYGRADLQSLERSVSGGSAFAVASNKVRIEVFCPCRTTKVGRESPNYGKTQGTRARRYSIGPARARNGQRSVAEHWLVADRPGVRRSGNAPAIDRRESGPGPLRPAAARSCRRPSATPSHRLGPTLQFCNRALVVVCCVDVDERTFILNSNIAGT